MLEKIEKEIGLDNNLQDAKNELQTIRDKLTPHFSTIDYCYYLIKEEESSGDKSKELDEHQLEGCKKALEEMEGIIYLTSFEEDLLKKINKKLKILNLEEEIIKLKNSKVENPQQQAENQKKIAEREKELEQIKKNNENDNKQHTPKDKDNENYKNWTYKRLVVEIKKLKTEIELLKRSEGINSSEKQLELRMKLEKFKRRNEQNSQLQLGSDKFPVNWVIEGGMFLGIVITKIIILVRNPRVKKQWNVYLTRKSNFTNKNIRSNEKVIETLKWREKIDNFNLEVRFLLVKSIFQKL